MEKMQKKNLNDDCFVLFTINNLNYIKMKKKFILG